MAGRGRPGQSGQLKGVSWDFDETLKLESKPSELFPPHPSLKRPTPSTDTELKQLKYYKDLQEQVHRGPLYTQPTKRDPNAPTQTFSEDQYNRQFATNTKADMDPFTGVETYSMKYAPKKNVLPKLSSRPFNKELFPKELWSTLEGTEGEAVRAPINRAVQKKALLLGDMASNTPSDKASRLLEKIHRVAGEGDEGEEQDDDGEEEREVDDEYADEDLGDDYDAEKYFDDGEGGSDAEDAGGDGDY